MSRLFFTACYVNSLSSVNLIFLSWQNTLINNGIRRWGTKEQQEKWLPRLAKDTLGSFCLRSSLLSLSYEISLIELRVQWMELRLRRICIANNSQERWGPLYTERKQRWIYSLLIQIAIILTVATISVDNECQGGWCVYCYGKYWSFFGVQGNWVHPHLPSFCQMVILMKW